jgi:photosystem II stability/assembly factor-like uncharacterized protein
MAHKSTRVRFVFQVLFIFLLGHFSAVAQQFSHKHLKDVLPDVPESLGSPGEEGDVNIKNFSERTINPDYQWKNPSLHSLQIRSINYINEQLVVATGNRGVAMVSHDAGITWQEVTRPFSSNIVTQAISPNGRWLVTGPSGQISFSDDMGETWQASENNSSNELLSLFFHNNDTVFACGRNRTVRKSTDGGLTWSNFAIPHSVVSNPFNKTNWAYRGLSSHGQTIFVGMDGMGMPFQVLKSTDLGATWTAVVADMNHPSTNQGAGITDMVFLENGLHGYASYRRLFSGGVMRTFDGGQSWEAFTSISGFAPLPNPEVPYISTTVQTMHCLSVSSGGDTLITAGAFGQVLASVDGGQNWYEIYGGVRQGFRDFYSVNFHGVGIAPDNSSWLVGGTRGIIAGAGTFEPATASVYNGDDKVITIVDAAFADQQKGYAVGFETVELYEYDENDNVQIVPLAVGVVFITEDGGDSWSRIEGPGKDGYRWYTVKAFGSDLIYMGGMKYVDEQIIGVIMRSEDGGDTWHEDYTVFGQEIACINGFHEENVFAVTFENRFLQRFPNDLWISTTLPSPVTASNGARTIELTAPNVIFVGGGTTGTFGNAFILRSTDKGQSWETIFTSGNAGRVNDIKFSDARFGFATGRWGSAFSRRHLLYTQDYGETWEEVLGTFAGVNSAEMFFIAMTDSATARVYGQFGQVVKANGSQDFIPVLRPNDATIMGGHFYNANQGVVGGIQSSILLYEPETPLNTAPGKFANMHPEPGQTLEISGTDESFIWSQSIDPDGDDLVYEFILENLDGTAEIRRDIVGEENFFVVNFFNFGEVEPGSYRWRVEAADSGGLVSTTHPTEVNIMISGLSDVATLDDLMVDGQTIEGFDPVILEYFLDLPPSTSVTPEITAVPTHENAQVVIVPATDIFSDDAAERTTTITVTAEDMFTTMEYAVQFYVISDDASLSDLKVNGQSLPGFDPMVLHYEMLLPIGTDETPLVTATPAHAQAQLSIDPAADVNSQDPLERTTTVTVTAEDQETTTVYTILFEVEMPVEYYTVTFNLEDAAGDPVEFAIITFNGITNPEGDYVFENIEEGTYDYSIQALFFQNISETGFDVYQDTLVTLVMTSESGVGGIDQTEHDHFVIFPNPAKTHFVVKAGIPMEDLTLVDAFGNVVKSVKPSAMQYSFDIGNLKSGLYLLRISTAKGHSVKKVIIQ